MQLNTQSQSIFQRLKLFLLLILLLIGIGLLYVGLYGKAGSYQQINGWLKPELDELIRWSNWIGDGIFVLAIGLILVLLKRQREMGVAIILSYAISGGLAQLLKRIILSPRPEAFFKNQLYQDILNQSGNTNLFHSFPSGHTTSAFALATVLAYYFDSFGSQIIFLLLALLAGFSRIYLGQHFLTDVMAGMVLGTSISLLILMLIRRMNERKNINKKSRTSA
jgi:membrane-associated phospholipid phosphatase